MKTERIDDAKLKIIFDTEDLLAYGLSFEDLDYADVRTREALQNALSIAREETGFEFCGGRLFIEIFPERGGGCCALFTKLPTEGSLSANASGKRQKRTYSFTKDHGLCLVCFDSFDSLCDCARAFDPQTEAYLGSDLFRLDGQYFLLMRLTGPFPKRATAIRRLAEYGAEQPRPYLKKLFLEEHGETLLEKKALEALRPTASSICSANTPSS